MIRRLYDWLLKQAGHRHAEPVLAAMCFAESSVLPGMPEVLMFPMLLADRRRAWRIGLICTISSTFGGLLGYAVGFLLLETVAEPLLHFYGATDAFRQFSETYAEIGWVLVLAGGGLTPLPYKIIAIASGAASMDLLQFLLLSLLARGTRFYIPCLIFYVMGPAARDFIEANLKLVFWLGLALSVIGGALVLYWPL